MSNKKKEARAKKEEQRANRVLKIVVASLVVLGLAMLIAFSFFS